MTVCLGLREFRGDANALPVRLPALRRLALLRRPPLLLLLLRLRLFRFALPSLLGDLPGYLDGEFEGDLDEFCALPAKIAALSS